MYNAHTAEVIGLRSRTRIRSDKRACRHFISGVVGNSEIAPERACRYSSLATACNSRITQNSRRADT
jgi:hypothetical protein